MLAALFVAGVIAGQTNPAAAPLVQEPGTELPGIDVTGARAMEERARAYVSTVASPPRNRNPARWENRVCIAAVNMGPTFAQSMVDRVSQVAQELGLSAGDPGCDPDVLIVMAEDAQQTAAELVRRRPGVFRPEGNGVALGRDELEAFTQGSAAIRWWHVSTVVDMRTRMPAVTNGDRKAPLALSNNVGPSFIRTQLGDYLRKAIIVIDADQVGEIGFDRLSDYVAFVALAQVDADADYTGHDTILNLLKDPQARLSEWDRAYLKSLYDVDPTLGGPGRLTGHIASGLVRALQTAP